MGGEGSEVLLDLFTALEVVCVRFAAGDVGGSAVEVFLFLGGRRGVGGERGWFGHGCVDGR